MAKSRKPVKVGAWQGKGPAPGYEWTVLILDCAFGEAAAALTPGQYEHVSHQIRDLALHRDPTHCPSQKIDQVESFWELKDKHGILGKKNVRVYWDVYEGKEGRALRVLAFDVKKNEGPMLQAVRDRVKRRQRRWSEGHYPLTEIIVLNPRKEQRKA